MLKKRRFEKEGVVKVTFSLPQAVEAESVHLVGEFTDWQGTPLAKQKDGGWRATVDLEPGRTYEFRYLVDGNRWINDPQADRYVANPFGEENSVVETPEPAPRGGARTSSRVAAGGKKPGGAGSKKSGRGSSRAKSERAGEERGTERGTSPRGRR